MPGPFASRRRQTDHVVAPVASGDAQRLVRDLRFEIVPVKSAESAIGRLPVASPASVTCSPTKGLAATLDLTARLRDLGHDAVPHVAARLVTGFDEATRLAAWCRGHGVTEVFVVGGDSPAPHGPFPDALALLRALLDSGELRRVGVAAYPDGHVAIERPVLRAALLAKQALFEEAGIEGYATTQMCFEPLQVSAWLAIERLAGMRLPIHLGVPGVVDRRRLLAMGMRVGIGASLHYAKSNGGVLRPLMSPRTARYDPTGLVDAIARHAAELRIDGLHAFTFNSVGPTAAWRARLLDPSIE